MLRLPINVLFDVLDSLTVQEIGGVAALVCRGLYQLGADERYWRNRWSRYVACAAGALSIVPLVGVRRHQQRMGLAAHATSRCLGTVSLTILPSHPTLHPGAPETLTLHRLMRPTSVSEASPMAQRKAEGELERAEESSSPLTDGEGDDCLAGTLTSRASSLLSCSGRGRQLLELAQQAEGSSVRPALHHLRSDFSTPRIKPKYRLQTFAADSEVPSPEVSRRQLSRFVSSFSEGLVRCFSSITLPLTPNTSRADYLMTQPSAGMLFPAFCVEIGDVEGDFARLPLDEARVQRAASRIRLETATNGCMKAVEAHYPSVDPLPPPDGLNPASALPSPDVLLRLAPQRMLPLYELDHLLLYHFLLTHTIITSIQHQTWIEEEKLAIWTRIIGPTARSVETRFFFSELRGAHPRVYGRMWLVENSEAGADTNQDASSGALADLWMVGYGRVEVDVAPKMKKETFEHLSERLGLPRDFPPPLLWNVLVAAGGGYRWLAAHMNMFELFYHRTLPEAFAAAMDLPAPHAQDVALLRERGLLPSP